MNWPQIRNQVLERDGGVCQICFRPGEEVHHVIARRRGGRDVLDNLTCVCIRCHRMIELHAIQPLKEMTTVRSTLLLKRKLVKIGARLSIRDGKDRTMCDVIEYLVNEYERTHKDKKLNDVELD